MRLKKNNVALDVINFANPDNIGRLQAIINSANSGNEDSTCTFLDVPEGCSNITDVMITSPILQSDDMGGGAVGGDAGGAGAGAGGIPGLDPNMDPELAEAIRLSLEEANAAQANNNPPEPAVHAEQPPAAGVQPGLDKIDEDDGMYDGNDDEPQDDDEKALQEAI